MNKLDKTYTDLLQDILENGTKKGDRTGTGTISVFGRQIRHNMKEGFPLLTTKKMHWKGIVTELIWFLQGDTNIKYLVDNNCHIWDGDAYKNYMNKEHLSMSFNFLSQEEFINKIKTDDEFAKKWGELGPIYGKQWRQVVEMGWHKKGETGIRYIDQIANLIQDLKTNPDSRRLMVNAWNVGELDQMVLPPCHYGFQVYTRELSDRERQTILLDRKLLKDLSSEDCKKCALNTEYEFNGDCKEILDKLNIPIRAISLMWNQRSVDTFLGLPFNIASYGLLLEILAKEVNMIPDELIGNLGDVHLYSNHIEQAREQIGRELTHIERIEKLFETNKDAKSLLSQDLNEPEVISSLLLDELKVPTRTREPYPLPTLKMVGHPEEYNYPSDVRLFEEFDVSDFVIENYQSHPTIKAPLSN
jgi:thymidylate synthase